MHHACDPLIMAKGAPESILPYRGSVAQRMRLNKEPAGHADILQPGEVGRIHEGQRS
jgi:hypothetical protein